MKVVFFDLETTGTLVNKHGIHQISGMIVIDGEVKETFDFKVQPNPKAEIVQEALDVAGVTKEQILSYPAMGYVYGQFTAILNKYVDKYNKQDKFFLAGYNNASFDNQFLRAWFLQMENFKQGTVAKALGIEIDESRLHDALYDIQVCKSIYDIVSPYKM